MTEPSRQHAGAKIDKPSIPEPTHAEKSRTLMHLGRVGSLSTLSRKRPGWPFGSVMPYGLDEGGRPILLISSMAVHTQNVAADPRAGLLVAQPDWEGDPLGAARVTLMGQVSRVPEPELARARELYLSRHPNANYWVDFGDFAFHRLEVVDVYFVGGFGVMGWVAAEDYAKARVDPLADAAPGIIRHMNADHAQALVLLSLAFGGIQAQEAVMTALDRLGFHLRLKTGNRVHGARIAFAREIKDAQDARTVLTEMVRQAPKSAGQPASS